MIEIILLSMSLLIQQPCNYPVRCPQALQKVKYEIVLKGEIGNLHSVERICREERCTERFLGMNFQ